MDKPEGHMKSSRSNTIGMVMAAFLIVPFFFAGCANVQHQAKLDKAYLPKEDVSIKVDKVVNDTGFDFDIDIEAKLADALEDQLLEEDLLWLGGEEPAALSMEKPARRSLARVSARVQPLSRIHSEAPLNRRSPGRMALVAVLYQDRADLALKEVGGFLAESDLRCQRDDETE